MLCGQLKDSPTIQGAERQRKIAQVLPCFETNLRSKRPRQILKFFFFGGVTCVSTS